MHILINFTNQNRFGVVHNPHCGDDVFITWKTFISHSKYLSRVVDRPERIPKKVFRANSSRIPGFPPPNRSPNTEELEIEISKPNINNFLANRCWTDFELFATPCFNSLFDRVEATISTSGRRGVFSVASSTVKPNRSSLDPDTVEASVTINCNIRQLRDLGLKI